MVSAVVPVLRVATVEDLDEIAVVVRMSVLELFPGFYDERQTASAAVHIAHVDPILVADGTYFASMAYSWSVRSTEWSNAQPQNTRAERLRDATGKPKRSATVRVFDQRSVV